MLGQVIARSKRPVSLSEFAYAGTPQRAGEIDLDIPVDPQYVLRMPIRVEGGEYAIPPELEWLSPMLAAAVLSQSVLGVDHPFCYVTIRSGPVISKTDDEWHVDGFSTKVAHCPEQNYVWCDKVATEYADIRVTFPEDFDPLVHNVNKYLEQFVNDINTKSCVAGNMYLMDPYMVHRRPTAASDMDRTFVRISFVPIEINDLNNTQNPMLPREYNQDGVVYRNKLEIY